MGERRTPEQLMEEFGDLLITETSKLARKWSEMEAKIAKRELEIRKPMDDDVFRAEVGAHRERVRKAVFGEPYTWVQSWFPQVVLNDFGKGSAWAKKYGPDVDWVNLFVHIAHPAWRDRTDWNNTLARFLGEDGATSVTRLYTEKLYGQAVEEFKRRFGDGGVEEPEWDLDSGETFKDYDKRRKAFWANLESNPDYVLMDEVREALEGIREQLYGSDRGDGKGGKGDQTPREPTLQEQIEKLQEDHEEAGNRLAELMQLARSAADPKVMVAHAEAARGVEAEANRLQRELDELKLKQMTEQRVEAAAATELKQEATTGGTPLVKLGEVVLTIAGPDDLSAFIGLITAEITRRPTAGQYLIEIRGLERKFGEQFAAAEGFSNEIENLQKAITDATGAGQFGSIGQLGGQLTQRMTSLRTATAQMETITKRLGELRTFVEAEPEKAKPEEKKVEETAVTPGNGSKVTSSDPRAELAAMIVKAAADGNVAMVEVLNKSLQLLG